MAAQPTISSQVTALILFMVLCFGAAWIGSHFTSTSLGTWYVHLEKPSWTPSGRTIGLIWTALYFMMALAAWLVWRSGPSQAAIPALALFFVQLALNVVWSALFFGLRSPEWASLEIVLLWLAIAATTIAFFRVNLTAGALMIPYLVWVSFASYLCVTIWRLNAGG